MRNKVIPLAPDDPRLCPFCGGWWELEDAAAHLASPEHRKAENRLLPILQGKKKRPRR